MKASFLFNILGTIADNLRALMNLLLHKKKIGPQCERVPRESGIVMALVGWEWT